MKLSDAISLLSVGDSACSSDYTLFRAEYGFEDADGNRVDLDDYDGDSEGWWVERGDGSDETSLSNMARIPARHWYM